MKRLIFLCGVVIYFAVIPISAPFLASALLGFSGTFLQWAVLVSIIMLPWLPVVVWGIVRLSRRGD
jgi:hypothetical protein